MDFDGAVEMVRCGSLPDVSDSVKLRLYGLYKMSTEGSPPETTKTDLVSRKKREAWEEALSLHKTREAAKKEYAKLVTSTFLSD